MSKGNIITQGLFVAILMQASGIQADVSCIPHYPGENLWCFNKRIAQELCLVRADSQSCCQTLQEQINNITGVDSLSCCEFLESRINVLDQKIESCCDSIPTGSGGTCLVFTPFDLSKSDAKGGAGMMSVQFSPDHTFLERFDGGTNTNIRQSVIAAWSLKKVLIGTLDNQRLNDVVSVAFQIPTDFDPSRPVNVDFHFLADNGALQDNAQLELNAAFAGNGALTALNYNQTVNSGVFTVDPSPDATQLRHYRITITLSPMVISAISGQDWAYLMVRRIVPATGTDYAGEIFLSGITFRYNI